jgi:hypothetical protein
MALMYVVYLKHETEEITDLYQNILSFLARIKYIDIEQDMYRFNMQIQ